MWHDDLPNTIDGLLHALRSNDLTFEQARSQQQERFRRGAHAYGCVVRKFDEPWAKGLSYSGVGVAHKDIFEHDGYLPGMGRDRGRAQAGAKLAKAPALLREQGMCQMGALTMAEDASAATGFTRNLEPPINPLNPTLAVGGSSSGSAVAVAGGMVYASLGTDTAGSVRIPAMTCGVMGLKTTHGLVDRQGMSLVSPSLDSIGVLARSVSDLKHVLGSVARGLVEIPQSPLRVSYWDAFEDLGVGQSETVQQVDECFKAYAIPVRAQVKGHFDRASHHVQVVMSTEVGRTQKSRIQQGQACEEARQLGMIGEALPPRFYHQSCVQRPMALELFLKQVMFETDVLMLPLQLQGLPSTSEVYPGGGEFNAVASLAMHRMCGWINYLGLPSLAMPVGRDAEGNPISVQLIARPRHENLLLTLGQKIQNDLYGLHGILSCAPQQKEN